jgi:hypothetical protein
MHRLVMMDADVTDLVMPMLCRAVWMAGERPARIVPGPLPVAEAAAPSLRLVRGTRGVMMGMRGAAVGTLRAAMGM